MTNGLAISSASRSGRGSLVGSYATGHLIHKSETYKIGSGSQIYYLTKRVVYDLGLNVSELCVCVASF